MTCLPCCVTEYFVYYVVLHVHIALFYLFRQCEQIDTKQDDQKYDAEQTHKTQPYAPRRSKKHRHASTCYYGKLTNGTHKQIKNTQESFLQVEVVQPQTSSYEPQRVSTPRVFSAECHFAFQNEQMFVRQLFLALYGHKWSSLLQNRAQVREYGRLWNQKCLLSTATRLWLRSTCHDLINELIFHFLINVVDL